MEERIYRDLQEAIDAIQNGFNGDSPIYLNFSNQLLKSKEINLAVIDDAVFNKGYYADGFEEMEDFTRVKYSLLESEYIPNKNSNNNLSSIVPEEIQETLGTWWDTKYKVKGYTNLFMIVLVILFFILSLVAKSCNSSI